MPSIAKLPLLAFIAFAFSGQAAALFTLPYGYGHDSTVTVTVPTTVTNLVTSTLTCTTPTITLHDTTTVTATVTATQTAFPEFCCPSNNRVANPGFEDNSAWTLGSGMTIVKTAPGQGADENVIVADFSDAGQTHTFQQTITNLCPGLTYNFQADIQMWTGSGSAHADFFLGANMFFQSQSLSVGPWVTVHATVVPTAATMVLKVNVVSDGAAGARRFVLDDFVLQRA